MKQFKKVTAFVLTAAMALSMGVSALAANTAVDSATSNISVTVTLQSAKVPEGKYNPALTDLTKVKSIDTVNLSVPSGSTVKDVVNALPKATIASCGAADGSLGCVDSAEVQETGDTLCACDNCLCTWKKVAHYDTTTWQIDGYASALNSLVYNGKTYSASATYTEEGDKTRYTGQAWEYWVNESYASDYMNNVSLTSDTDIVLSYDTSTFTY